jgi:hypothetical protein
MIAETAMLAHALRLAPYKDGFLSQVTEHPECRFKLPTTPKLEAYVSALSGGPVGLGDVVGATNKELVLRTCRPDGLLLRPQVPVVPLDL